jgi:signal transduction histidine kinase
MMVTVSEETGLRVTLKLGGKSRVFAVSQDRMDQVRSTGRIILREPFLRRPWMELLWFCLSCLLTVVGAAWVGVTLICGVPLLVIFVGLLILVAMVQGARRIGGWHRALAHSLLEEQIESPEPLSSRPGFSGWLKSSLTDRTGWRAIAYSAIKCPLMLLGIYAAFSVWFDATFWILSPFFESGSAHPPDFGIMRQLFGSGFISAGSGFPHGLLVFVCGVLALFVAPWPMRLLIAADQRLMRGLLGPDSVAQRVRSLEQARSQTVDASAARLRQIERDLHDGTQAQLVALAMRLGQAKDKLGGAADDDTDLDAVRRLVDEAHQGAKDAIVELRDLARGIHPPALDTGLEGALATLAARSSLPTELSVTVDDRPTPAIESITYFCVAELLANVAQHAHASHARISCAQHGQWLRVVVRDDGRGGAHLNRVGSSSSGLAGLTDRVHAVDGVLHLASPPGGPTVVTMDLPLHV